MPKRTCHPRLRTLFRKHQLWAGIGGVILAPFLGWGVPMIPYDLYNGVLITLAGFLISVPFFVRALQLYIGWNIKKRTWLIIVIAIIASVVVIATQLQFTNPRPKLRIDFDSSSIIASTGEIKFHIINRGQDTAYQYSAIIFVAPVSKLDEVMLASKTFGTNSIEPGESVYLFDNITQPNKPTGVWYFYLKFIYSNSPTRPSLYINDSPYWLSCDFDNPQNRLIELTPTQRDIFKAAINTRYPDVDVK
jgi:hypothetical protein